MGQCQLFKSRHMHECLYRNVLQLVVLQIKGFQLCKAFQEIPVIIKENLTCLPELIVLY
jgi:hypothetical protein